MLTSAQLTTWKSDIAANTATTTQFPGVQIKDLNLTNSDHADAIARWYNQLASPDWWSWRSGVTKSEMVGSTSVDGTTFNWVGNGFITRSVGEQAAWSELFDRNGNVNPSLTNVRQAFTDIFSGSGNAAANRTHLATVSRRKVSFIEKLLATGTGSTGSPGTMGFEGAVTYTDLQG